MRILWAYLSWSPLRDELGGAGGGEFLCWCGFVYLQDLCGQIFKKLINVMIVKFVPHKRVYVRCFF